MTGLHEECLVINEIWDHDPIEAMSTTDPDIVGFDNHGVAAITEKNVLWVGELGGQQVVIKVPRQMSAPCSVSRQNHYLKRLNSRRFPQIVAKARSLAGKSYPAFELQKTKIPMYLWLEANLPTHDKVSVTRDLLTACAELEGEGILHQDLCPRNVLVDPDTNHIAVIDFEFAQFAGTETRCVGGENGFAAPEQYLNWLGRCSHLTESFFVGTVLFYAFYPEYLNSKLSFPFTAASPHRMPADCYAAMWALLGDATKQYSPDTRYKAIEVFRKWGDLPTPPCSPILLASNPVPRKINYDIHEGLTVCCSRKGILVMRGKELVSRYDGLLDMEKIKIQFEADETRIGAAVVGKSGTIRLSLPGERLATS
jgi:predicted Ser/Thr protein kinase